MAVRFDFCWLLQRPAVRFFLLLVSSPILFRVSAVKRPPLFFFVGCCCCSCSPTHKAYSIYILTPFHFFFFVCRSLATKRGKSLSPPTGGMCTRTSLAALPTSVHDRAKREWSKTPPSIGLTFSFGFVHPPSLRARFESVSNRNGMRVKREQFHLRLAR